MPLSQHKPSRYSDSTWLLAYLTIYLRRPADVDHPLAVVHSEETDEEIRLTIDEAQQLRDELTAALNNSRAGLGSI